jgi:hypothetical protein
MPETKDTPPHIIPLPSQKIDNNNNNIENKN